MRKKVIFSIGILTVTILISCGVRLHDDETTQTAPAPVPTSTAGALPTLTIYGPPGFKEILTAFEPFVLSTGLYYDFQVRDGNRTQAGIQGVLNGTFDMMVLMRRPLPDEPVAFTAFAQTPIAVFVHPDAEIHELTAEQAAALFAGSITNWSELGGANLQVVIFVQENDDATTIALHQYLPGDRSFPATTRIVSVERDMFTLVESVPGSVGYAAWAGKRFWEYTQSTTFIDPIKLDGFFPTDPGYPITNPIGAAYLPENQWLLQPIFDWAHDFAASDLAQPLLTQMGVQVVDQTSDSPEDNANGTADATGR